MVCCLASDNDDDCDNDDGSRRERRPRPQHFDFYFLERWPNMAWAKIKAPGPGPGLSSRRLADANLTVASALPATSSRLAFWGFRLTLASDMAIALLVIAATLEPDCQLPTTVDC